MRQTRRTKDFGKNRNRRGAALVEMAACLPIFMLTLLGIIEFGRAMSVSQLLNAAAREGCRAAILDGATETSVRTAVVQQVANTVNVPTQAVTVQISVTVGSTNTATTMANVKPRDTITINITVPHSAVSYSVSRWLAGKTLRGKCVMRHE